LEPLESRTLLVVISISPSGSQWTIDERMSTTPNPPLSFTVSCAPENGEDLSCMQQLVRVNLGIGGTAGSSDFFDTACDDNGQRFVWVPASGGDTSFSIIPINDGIGEGDETIEVSLSGVDASLAYCDGTCDDGCGGCCGGGIHEVDYHLDTNQLPSTITIQDDDNWAIKAERTSTAEGIVERTGTAAFSLSRVDDGSGRSGDMSYAIAVDFTMSGTADDGVDYYLTDDQGGYLATYWSAEIPATEGGVGIGLVTNNDHVREPDETAVLAVGSAQSVPDQYGQFAGGSYGADPFHPDDLVYILDDDWWVVTLKEDGPPGNPRTVIEEEGPTSTDLLLKRTHEVMTPSRPGDTSYPIDVTFDYGDGYGHASASDYLMIESVVQEGGSSQEVTRGGETTSFQIQEGQTQKAIEVKAVNDGYIELLRELLEISIIGAAQGGQAYTIGADNLVEIDIENNDEPELFAVTYQDANYITTDPVYQGTDFDGWLLNSKITQDHWFDKDVADAAGVDRGYQGDRAYPVSYLRSEKYSAKGEWRGILEPGYDMYVQVEGPGTGGVLYSDVIQVTPGTQTLTATAESNNAFSMQTLGAIEYFPSFELIWKYKVVEQGGPMGGLPDRPAGTSANEMYATYEEPIGSRLYHSVVHIGTVAGESAGQNPLEAAVVAAAWAPFNGLNVNRRDGVQLRYYNPVGSAVNTEQLLTLQTGQCRAWAKIFIDVLAAQGIGASQIEIKHADNGTGLLVRGWDYAVRALAAIPCGHGIGKRKRSHIRRHRRQRRVIQRQASGTSRFTSSSSMTADTMIHRMG
jgi:hypothetical protein